MPDEMFVCIRSRLAANSGARTPMFSLFVSFFTLLSTFFLLRFLYTLPKAVLASIVTLVVYSILAEAPEDVHYFIKMGAWQDVFLMILTFFLTLFVSVQVHHIIQGSSLAVILNRLHLQTGIIVSVGVSLVLVVRQSSRSMGVQIMGRVPGTENWSPIEDDYTATLNSYEAADLLPPEEIPGVLIVRLRETLHFANAGALKERLNRLERYGMNKHHPSSKPTRQEAQTVVFHLSDLRGIDATAVQILLETCRGYRDRSVAVYMVHLNRELRKALDIAGLIDVIGQGKRHSYIRCGAGYD